MFYLLVLLELSEDFNARLTFELRNSWCCRLPRLLCCILKLCPFVSADGLAGRDGVLLLRGGTVLVSSGSWSGSAGAGLHLDDPQSGRGQPWQPSARQLPYRRYRSDYRTVEEELAAEGEGGRRHCGERCRELQETVRFHPRGTRRLHQTVETLRQPHFVQVRPA